MKNPTQTEIVSAITRAAIADFSGFEVIFDHPNYHTDRRSGHIHGWNEGGWYLGNFTSHKRALEAGARFCKLGNTWLDWGGRRCVKCGAGTGLDCICDDLNFAQEVA